MNFLKKNMKGFTLVELLIVIGILAVLTAVVIIALNPVQNLAKARDTGRLSSVAQLGHALEAYATSNNGNYVAEAGCGNPAGWGNCIVTSGDINQVPSQVVATITTINGSAYTVCGDYAAATQNGWCYDASAAAGTQPAVVYTRLEAAANHAKCDNPTTEFAWAVYSTADGKAGVVCTATSTTEPVPGVQVFK